MLATSNKIGALTLHNACKLVLGVSCLLLLQGCQDRSMSDLREFVATAYQDRKPEIEPLPEIEPFQAFEYSASNADDPFDFDNISTERESDGQSASKRPDANRRREALENFPLDALKLVGTLSKENVPWVIVQTNEGKAHLAKTGNYLGQNDGKIKFIDPDRQLVQLEETVRDAGGRWVTRELDLKIDE
jgi:Tfp pilus assembly protein PilP